MKIQYSYLAKQFNEIDNIISKIKEVVKNGDFTIGDELIKFEKNMSSYFGMKYGIGVNSGTDALLLSLKSMGIGQGDEVITSVQTFVATINSIILNGATPKLVDCKEDYTIDEYKIESAITNKTKAIVPVHYTGQPCEMDMIMQIAEKYNLVVVEDSCTSIGSSINGKLVGTYGDASCLSFHPLKNLNVWGDSGMILTNNTHLYNKLKIIRNYGLISRDELVDFGFNSKMDTIQAAIANVVFDELPAITEARINNATYLDTLLSEINEIKIPKRSKNKKQVFHLYIVLARDRDKLLSFLKSRGIEAKIHYPIPIHLQEACRQLEYKKGDFPVCEYQCENIITLPVHQYSLKYEIEYITETIKQFYN